MFRIGIDGLPFLMPLLLQLGFGLTPLASGLLTFATYAGAMTMKASATPILRTLGFRQVLIGNAVICGLFMASYGLFRPTTPQPRHPRDLAGRRVLPLAPGHLDQHARLRRRAAAR